MRSAVTSRLARRRRRQGRASRDFGVVSEPNPSHPELLADFRFFAVLGTWMEEDVVEATVRNAFAQGVEAVYLVDNGSTDATVERAVAAGATLAESYRTEVYDERIRILLMNGQVARASLASGAQHVWWLWLDADEFPEGPGGMTIVEYLRTLDRRFRLVGSTFYNHYPTTKPEYLPGFHPLDFQPLCERFVPDQPRYCPQPHWKHPLQRFDRNEPFLSSIIGFHSAAVLRDVPMLEPVGGIVTHHIQHREEAVTRARMDLLCRGPLRNAYNDSVGNRGIGRRFETLDAVYEQRWSDVNNLLGAGIGVDLQPWTGPANGRRWYREEDRQRALVDWAAARDSVPD
jgi:hypothetical protein